jgi:guanosine-3',5'-bis(diphosphate) 3'-pyrophosphohydrolase
MNDTTLLLDAAIFAAHKHRAQRRKDAAATPFINHPLAVARALAEEGGVRDPEVLAAALLHDTIEDTETTYDELRGHFGARIADLVVEVTDTKFLAKRTRKRLQLSKARRASVAARQIKIADKLCNLRDILAVPPADWSAKRKREYFDWAKAVVDQVRGANPRLARKFDRVWEAGRSRRATPVQGSCRVSGSLLIRDEDSGLGRARSGGGLDGRTGVPLPCGAAAGAVGRVTGAAGRATGSADLGSRSPRGA